MEQALYLNTFSFQIPYLYMFLEIQTELCDNKSICLSFTKEDLLHIISQNSSYILTLNLSYDHAHLRNLINFETLNKNCGKINEMHEKYQLILYW